ncbi:MAG: UPF0175 family protein [Terriglobia bacterium]
MILPDDLAAPLLPPGQEPARAVLEAIALEAYRQRRITGYQVRVLLGIPSRYELDGFLKEHQVEKYTAEDFEHDLATIEVEARDRRGYQEHPQPANEVAAWERAASRPER